MYNSCISGTYKAYTLNPIRAKDEGAGGEQGGYKDREVDGRKQENKESGKEANFYFFGLTPFLSAKYYAIIISYPR
jgi:hypothetical protein